MKNHIWSNGVSFNKTVYSFEIYTNNPKTGQGGWYIEFCRVFADTLKEAREILKTVPNFDCEILYNGEKIPVEDDVRAYADGLNFREV